MPPVPKLYPLIGHIECGFLKIVECLHQKSTAHRLKCRVICRNLGVKAFASQKHLRSEQDLNVVRFKCSFLVYNAFLQM